MKNCALVGCGILLLCQVSAADERVARLDLDELEKAYWTCYQEAAERVVAHHRLDQIAMQVCGGISIELQRRKFDGDFGRLDEWTLLNRQPLAEDSLYSLRPYASSRSQDTGPLICTNPEQAQGYRP